MRDAAAVENARERGAVFEVCPSSNYLIKTVPSLEAHPVKRMIESGLLVTLNSDDPGLFDVSLSSELVTVGRRAAIARQS